MKTGLIIMALCALCSCGVATPFIDGDSGVLSTNEACVTIECLGSEDDFAPIIDTTILPDIEDQDVTPSESVTEPDESDDNSPQELCDSSVDADGDGLSCDCDSNDDSAWNVTVTANCDNDGDDIPNEYDLCPNHDDRDDVIVISLCDVDDSNSYDGVVVDVDYDESRWSCFKKTHLQFAKATNKAPVDLSDFNRPTLLVNFPVQYIFPDENQDDHADGCLWVRKLGTLSPRLP